MKMDSEEIDEIIAHLIGSNFLNESGFSVLPEETPHQTMGKRITNELKFSKITTYNINFK
jgi:regulatory protein